MKAVLISGVGVAPSNLIRIDSFEIFESAEGIAALKEAVKDSGYKFKRIGNFYTSSEWHNNFYALEFIDLGDDEFIGIYKDKNALGVVTGNSIDELQTFCDAIFNNREEKAWCSKTLTVCL